MKTKQTNRGVTLVEIAIVLVIIGLLLGGVLKGQELINNAKVRAMTDRQNSLKVAWFAFIDRYQGLPGDYKLASRYIAGAPDGSGDGIVDEDESVLVFQHLTAAGYLRCGTCTATAAADTTAENSLVNAYGGVMSVWNDSEHYSLVGSAAPDRPRLMVHTGPRIPSNIIAEVDRKMDDGIASGGDFVFNKYDPIPAANGGLEPLPAECMTKAPDSHTDDAVLFNATPMYWRHIAAAPPIEQNCGASVNI